MSLFDHAVPNAAGYRDIDPAEVRARAASARVVDVREPDEYAGELGHIDGAALVPLATLAAAAASWPRGEDVVLVCRSGARSGRGAAMLAQELGFARVMNLRGGMMAWNSASYPIAR
jgi:sulfur-carrier protein adenylyltransferase/sulfurtransferase